MPKGGASCSRSRCGSSRGVDRGSFCGYLDASWAARRRSSSSSSRVVVFSFNGVPADKIESAQRAHDVFKMKCPVYRSVHHAIDVITELKLDSETQTI